MTGITETYAATQHLPPFLKQQARESAWQANPQEIGGGQVPQAVAERTALDAVWAAHGDFERAITEQGAARIAQDSRWAGGGEVWWDAVKGNVTGRLYDLTQRGDDDPDFKLGEEHIAQLRASGVSLDKGLEAFVADARNQVDFERRLDIAVQRKDLFERMGNTQGWQAFGNGVMGFLGGMSDPAAIAASIATGGAVAAARGAGAARAAALTGRGPWVRRGAAAGAAENMAAEAFIAHADNQDVHWGQMVSQGIFGAGLGALGGLLARRSAVRLDAQAAARDFINEHLANAAARNVQDVLQSRLDAAWRDGAGEPYIFGRAADSTLSTDIADLPVQRAVPVTLAAAAPKTPEARLSAPRPLDPALRTGPPQLGHPAGTSVVGQGRVPQVRRLYTGGEGNQIARFSRGETGSSGFAEIQHARYQAFRKQGLIEEVRADELEGLPANAKAVFVPEDAKVYIIRERLTPQEAADPTGLIAHEIGVHYGLARTLGREKYDSVLGEVNRLAQTDARVKAALDAVPADTPAHLVLEEALGYFAEQNPRLGVLARVLADIRTWLREHVPLFKHLQLTGNEILRMVQGSVEAARNPAMRVAEAGDVRYSMLDAAGAAGAQLRLSAKAQAITDAANKWAEKVDPAAQKQQERLHRFYEEIRKRAKIDGVQAFLDSPGLILARSNSKVVRYLGTHLLESASGYGKRTSTVAIEYEQMAAGYKHQAIPPLKALLAQGMTATERADYMVGGGKAAQARIWHDVIAEGQRRRQAAQTKVPYESSAPAYVQKAATVLDDFFAKVVDDGIRAGNPLAGHIKGAGTVGHIPYEWQWEKISKAYIEDPVRYQAFHDNLAQQYSERIVEPAVQALAEKGTATADDLMALRKRLAERVANMVDNKLHVIMQDPQARLDGAVERFEIIASDLLDENFVGERVTPEFIGKFKEQLGDIVHDRTRTELDLLREVNGVSLLDFLQTDALAIVTHGAHRWAGLNALARKGFTELADAHAAVQAARTDKATPLEQQALDFAFRAFGLGQLRNHERAAFTALRNFTFASMMGKLGLNVLADLGSVMAATGLRGFFATLGHAVLPETELVKQMAVDTPGLLGRDYLLHSLTPDVSATGRIMVGEGSRISRLSQRAAQATAYLSFANTASRMLHKGFLPVFTEDVLRTLRGENGGMSKARLADLGIDSELAGRIKVQLAAHDAGRERGGRINWDKWDDQQAAADFRTALHRGTFQVFQRAMAGEQPMWLTESAWGALLGQFRRFGMVSAEKQVARNAAIGDGNSAVALTVGLAWGAMLYAARLQANTLGMSEKEKQAWLERNATGWRLTAGILNLTNASGILPEGVALLELLTGGAQAGRGGVPVAGARHASNVLGAMSQTGAYVTGQGGDGAQAAKSLWRIAPASNTFLGTALMNAVAGD